MPARLDITSARARRRGRRGCRTLAALVCVLLLQGSGPALGAAEDEGHASLFFVGLGAGLCTLVYTPVKVVYAASSVPLAGLVYLWSVGDAEMAGRVILRATGGDFVVTPRHLRRQRALRFFGSAPPSD